MAKFAKQNLSKCTLSQLKRIKENQFRSCDNKQDYCPFEVELRIIEIQIKHARKLREEQRNSTGMDIQLAALLPIGQTLLNLIDQASKNLKAKDGVLLIRGIPGKESLKVLTASAVKAAIKARSEYVHTHSKRFVDSINRMQEFEKNMNGGLK